MAAASTPTTGNDPNNLAPTPEELGEKPPFSTFLVVGLAIGLTAAIVILWRLELFAPGPAAQDVERQGKLLQNQAAQQKQAAPDAADKVKDAMRRIAEDPKVRP